jgi:hypothetical protein
MIRWLIVSAIYAALFFLFSKFEADNAIAGGLLVGAISIGALKLFGMDKEK